MSYVQEVLGKDEAVQYAARVSLASYWSNFVIGFFFLLFALPMLLLAIIGNDGHASSMTIGFGLSGLVIIGWPFLARATTELVFTNRRIIAKFGVISRDTVEINFKKIESIRVKQGVIGRILNYGDVIVSGSGATHAPIPKIANPLQFRRAFDTAMEHYDQMENSKAAG